MGALHRDQIDLSSQPLIFLTLYELFLLDQTKFLDHRQLSVTKKKITFWRPSSSLSAPLRTLWKQMLWINKPILRAPHSPWHNFRIGTRHCLETWWRRREAVGRSDRIAPRMRPGTCPPSAIVIHYSSSSRPPTLKEKKRRQLGKYCMVDSNKVWAGFSFELWRAETCFHSWYSSYHR